MSIQELGTRYEALQTKMDNVKSRGRKDFYIKKQSELMQLYKELN